MSETKTTLQRFGGRSLARFIRQIERTSDKVYYPPDLMQRLSDVHPCIVACWHGQFMLVCALRPEGTRIAAMIARHDDAETLAETMRTLDVDLVRGAGAGERKRDRGGAAALRASLKALRGGASLVMTADIPPGPARVAGLGIVTIGRMSGLPIVPVAVATRRFMSFDTWSRMTVNLPYSKMALVGGEPVLVPPDADEAALERARLLVETRLNDATAKAYELAGADLKRATPLDQLAALSPPNPGPSLQVYQAAMSLLRPVVPVFLNFRSQQGKEDISRRGERFGFAGTPRPKGEVAWLHAASVGETNAILPLIDEILKSNADVTVLVTTGTMTSAQIAAKRLPERAIHQYVPLDVPHYVSRFLDHWKPSVSIFTESDIWPNLVLETHRRGVPLVLVNARMSPRSMRRWRRFAKFGRPLFSRFAIVLAQNTQVAKTIRRLGAPNVIVAGNLKIDAPPPQVDPQALATLKAAVNNRPIFLASSTHPGEDSIVGAAHSLMREDIKGLLTIIVPRHPSRGSALAATLGGLGLKTELRSRAAAPSADTEIYVADTIGELGTFYALSPVALIGGSLIEHGGQNPFEAIRHGAAVLTGPFTHNFLDSYAALFRDGGAVLVRSSDDIAREVTRLLTDPVAVEGMRQGASSALDSLSGALRKSVAAIQPLIETQRT